MMMEFKEEYAPSIEEMGASHIRNAAQDLEKALDDIEHGRVGIGRTNDADLWSMERWIGLKLDNAENALNYAEEFSADADRIQELRDSLQRLRIRLARKVKEND